MKRFGFVVMLLAGLLLSSCSRHYSWHQRFTLIVDTPDGERRGSSVQAIDVRYFPEWMRIDRTERLADLRGEAVVVDLGQGRYLFALLPAPGWAEWVYRDLGKRPGIYRAIERQAGKEPRELPAGKAPRLVTFGDVNDPTSVQAVNPDNLAATFGEGYALKAVTLGITNDPVTEGEVEKVLGWLDDLNGGMLDGRRISTIKAENRLANNLSEIDFLRDGSF